MYATSIRGIVRNGRVEFAEPIGLPEGTEVTISANDDDVPSTPEEIARDLVLMRLQEPWEIPPDIAADLDDWERQVNEYTKANLDRGTEDAFP